MYNAEWSDDAGSLTPPLEDIEKQWQDFGVDDDVINDAEFSSKRQKTGNFDENRLNPLFSCCHDISNKLCEKQKCSKLRGGYIELGYLSRLLQNEDKQDNLFQKPVFKLFDYQFITATALVEQRKKLFYILRQKIFEFENQEHDQGLSSYISQSGDNTWFYTHIRKQCCSFLMYINTFTHRNLPTFKFLSDTNEPHLQSWSSFPSAIRKDINNLWLFVGPVSCLPNASFLKLDGASNLKLPPAVQWLHLHLELKWGLIEALWRLYSVQDEKCVDQLTEIEEKTCALLRDLVYISSHINKGSTPSALCYTTPFLCACVKQLWVIMIHFLDFLSTSHGIKSFWSGLTTILNELLQRDKDQIKSFSFDVSEVSCKDPILIWWLLVHISPLYWYNVEGEYIFKEKANVSGNWILAQDLLRLSFVIRDGTKVQEDLSRCYLSCCLQISQHWHPNNDVVLLLWDYFHKKLNDLFYLPGQRIQAVSCSRETPPHQWFEQVLNRCNDPVSCNDNETSFELFLKIVALHLKKLKNTRALQGWKQLKGRFYSKFHKKRMEELSEQGLLSFFNLFLTLACAGELEDVSNKMLSFLELLDFKLLEFGKKKCIWKGYFVLLFLYKSTKTDSELITQKLSTYFTEICRNYKELNKDKIQRQNLWGLISQYLESSQEVLEYKSDEGPGDCKLIGEGFDILLPMCNDRDLQTLINFIQSMLAIVSNGLQDESKCSLEIAHSLWKHIFPHIRHRITDPTIAHVYLNRLTSLAVGFTLLSINVPPKNASVQTLETFHNLVRHFGVNDSMTASVSCQFLAPLLASQEALELIQCSNYQDKVIHTWFRCALQISSQDQNLLNLTRIVLLKIPETGNIIKAQRSIVAGNVEAAITALIRSLGERFSSLQLLADTVAFREKALVIFGDFLKYIETFLKQAGPPDFLRLSYKVSASIVRDCPKIIYRKTQHDCLLPKIIDQLILPLNAKKQLPPTITQCIKLNLTEFLEGLASLDFRRDEFIKRKIKQIFAAYFHIFNQKCYLSSDSSPIKNPFMEVLKGTLSKNPAKDLSDFRKYVMTIVKENFLVIPGCSPQELTPTLFFLVDLFKRTISPGETAWNTPLILKNILACLLACETSSPGTEPPHIRSKATKVLELMMISCQKAQDVTSRDDLLSLLKEFLFSNINQVQGSIFKVFNTLSKFDKELVLSIIPVSKQAILATERKRGVGTDTRLRTSFKSLLESLGVQGNDNDL